MPKFQLFDLRRPVLAATALAALLLVPAAQAASLSATGATGTPGGNATVSFEFDFGAATPLTSFLFELNWNPALLTLTDADALYNGMADAALAAALATSGTFTPNLDLASGLLVVSWFALDANMQATAPLGLSGIGVLSATFSLANSFATGSSTPVAVAFNGTDLNFDPSVALDASALITAVPEPTTWALMLGGGLALAGWARRRSVHHA